MFIMDESQVCYAPPTPPPPPPSPAPSPVIRTLLATHRLPRRRRRPPPLLLLRQHVYICSRPIPFSLHSIHPTIARPKRRFVFPLLRSFRFGARQRGRCAAPCFSPAAALLHSLLRSLIPKNTRVTRVQNVDAAPPTAERTRLLMTPCAAVQCARNAGVREKAKLPQRMPPPTRRQRKRRRLHQRWLHERGLPREDESR